MKPRAKFKGSAGASGRRAEVLRSIAGARGLSTAERCVLFAVEAHVGFADRDTGESWPSVATIGEASGMSERNARRTIARLHELGWLRIRARSRGGAQLSSAYTVTPVEGEPEEGRDAVH